MESIKLTYRPNFRHNFWAVQFGFWGTPRRILKFAVFSLLFGAALAVALGATKLPLYVAVLIGLFAAALWAAMFSLGFGAWAAASVTRRQRLKGDVQILVSDEYVERIAAGTSVKQQWSAISSVDERSRAFFMLDGARPIFLIEKSAVESPADMLALRQFLRAKKPGHYL